MDLPLDLSTISDLDASEAATLQSMRAHIRSASVTKLARIRMWETDNTLQLETTGLWMTPFFDDTIL